MKPAAVLAARRGPAWRGWLAAFLIAALIAASFISLKLNWADLLSASAIANMSDFIKGFIPPDGNPAMLQKTLQGSFETLSMSALGTLLASLAGLLLAIPASGRNGAATRLLCRWFLNLLRAVPELVWASVMLIAAGLGPFAGCIALAVHTTGVLGRLFADALENLPPGPEQTLRLNGASPGQVFLYASLPQALPQLLSYSLYRWENNIRAAAVLGVVGAGGLGQQLKFHLSLFQMPQAATVILAMLALVALVDWISYLLRRKLTR